MRLSAVAAAEAAFKNAYEERPFSGMTRVEFLDDTRLIVRVCYGDTRPPVRVWFSVEREGLATTELTMDEIGKYYDVQEWR